MLQAMREVCNHPVSLAKDRRPEGYTATTATDIELSGKCAKFHELLDTILAAGEKVLVFSSSLSAIDVLMQQIEKRKDKPQAMKIIGAVPQMEREAWENVCTNISQMGRIFFSMAAVRNPKKTHRFGSRSFKAIPVIPSFSFRRRQRDTNFRLFFPFLVVLNVTSRHQLHRWAMWV